MATPLAQLMRPKSFDDIIGQEHLTSKEAPFRKSIESGAFGSFILYGHCGTGKTSIVNVISQLYSVTKFNATTFSVKQLRQAIDQVPDGGIIHIDEIFRLTATQSDVLLPHVEDGRIRLIGCTSENPFHSMRSPLLSRCHIYVLEPLTQMSIIKILVRAATYLKKHGLNKIDKEAILYISRVANKDARRALTVLEAAFNCVTDSGIISAEVVKRVAPTKYYRLTTDDRYDLASAFQGSIQASDPDSAVYWLAKWLESGEDPRYIARRLLVSAHEDAASTPIAAAVAHSAYTAACEIGRPECDIALAHAAILIATAPRNKFAIRAIRAAISDIRKGIDLEVPKPMRDCHYKGSAKLGHGAYHDGANQEAYVGVKRKYVDPTAWKVWTTPSHHPRPTKHKPDNQDK